MKKYVTDIKNKTYLEESVIKEKKLVKNINNIINIDLSSEIANFLGFGSAITESSGYNYQKLSNENKKRFLDDYYSKDGLNFKFGRISIGSDDFSLNSYSYTKRKNLNDFNVLRDKKYVIPMLFDILRKKKITLIASPWSPPRIYKRLPILRFGIKLAKRYYDKYSNYLIKYLDEYQKLGININYLTMQNEPLARQRWESCVFSIKEQKEFIYNYLLPKISNTKVLLWDHNKDDLFEIVNSLYQENEKVGGVCFHYYKGQAFDEIKKVREKYPNMLLINSEMCCAYSPYNEINWISSAEYYLKDIIGDMNNGVNAYLDWNILLDKNGGPTHSKNYVKSPSILVNDNYIKSPIYYYLYHVSHFLGDKNKIIKTNSYTNKLKIVSYTTNNKIIVIIMNISKEDINYNLVFKDKYIGDSIKSHSITTYVL